MRLESFLVQNNFGDMHVHVLNTSLHPSLTQGSYFVIANFSYSIPRIFIVNLSCDIELVFYFYLSCNYINSLVSTCEQEKPTQGFVLREDLCFPNHLGHEKSLLLGLCWR